ncbi:MAG: phage tail sheath subtilisin-like domain-containing protein [Pseudomonadota bacterium]
MPSYLHPGVYVEEIPSGSRPIEGVATSVAAFVGAANRGPIGEPVLIGNFEDYVAEFGGIEDEDDDMGLAVQAYYLNGGGAAFICRLASGATSSSTVALDAADSSQAGILTVTATSPGAWGDEIYVRAADPKLLFDMEVSLSGTVQERYYGLSMDSTRGDFISTKVNGRSALVRVDNVVETLLLGTQASTALSDEDTDPTTSDTLTVQDTSPADVMVITDTTDGSLPVAVAISNISFVFDIHVGNRDTGGTFTAIESFTSVSMVSGSDDFAEDIINGESTLITVDVLTGATSDQYPVTNNDGDADGDDDGEQLTVGVAANPTAPDYTALYENTLRKFRDISIIVLPGESWADDGSGNSVVAATLSHCDKMKNRIVIVDPPAGHELENSNTVATMSLPTSTYSVLYYPWVDMANPLYHPDKAPDKSKTVQIPPSAIAAGMWAKIDGKRGVWKAPAGVEARLTGAAGLEFQVENLEQDQLNPLGVNCIRKLPNFGSVFWGARTLSTNADPEWRYVPVRRTAIYIEESIYRGIQWAVFEPNDHPLWSSLRANIGAFMNGLFRAGAFQGQTAKDAYFVRCGLGDTMTQGDIDRGQVIVMVGFAPLKPAEFVIVRIQQKVGEES